MLLASDLGRSDKLGQEEIDMYETSISYFLHTFHCHRLRCLLELCPLYFSDLQVFDNVHISIHRNSSI